MQNMIGIPVWYHLTRTRILTEQISVMATDEDMACMKADDAEWETLTSVTSNETCKREVY